jgi:ketosteroid isomerase-like protein
MEQKSLEEVILEKERAALDRWSSGDPVGYTESAAEDMSYFDDIGAQNRLNGLQSCRAYLSTLEGQIPAHSYELADTRVQVYGDVAILTLHYHPSSLQGEAMTPWKATTVYRLAQGEWRMVHANWSLLKEAE